MTEEESNYKVRKIAWGRNDDEVWQEVFEDKLNGRVIGEFQVVNGNVRGYSLGDALTKEFRTTNDAKQYIIKRWNEIIKSCKINPETRSVYYG